MPPPHPVPEIKAGYLDHILEKLEEGLQELAMAEKISGEDQAGENRCPSCGAPLSSSGSHGQPDHPPSRAN